jgi:hypothetical protein
MTKRVLFAGIGGFMIACFWMAIGLLSWSEFQPVPSFYYYTGEIICPICSVKSHHFELGPFANAILYAFVVWAISKVAERRKHSPQTNGR